MFSQQTKRVNIQNLQNPFPQYGHPGLVQGLQGGMQGNMVLQGPIQGANYQGIQGMCGNSVYSDFQQPYSNMNDNFSLYSSNSTATTMTNLKKRNFTEDLNLTLASCLDEFLPKVAEECAEAVYSKLNQELQRQSSEIDYLRSQLETIKNLTLGNFMSSFTTKNSTPMKKIKNMNEHLRKINSNLTQQGGVLKETAEVNNYLVTSSYLENISEKLKVLQETVEEQKRQADNLNMTMKDRYVDHLGIKNFLEEKVRHLLDDIKLNSQNFNSRENDGELEQIICSIDDLIGEIQKKPNLNNYENLEVQQGQGMDLIVARSVGFSSSKNANGNLFVVPQTNNENFNTLNFNFVANKNLSTSSPQISPQQMTNLPTFNQNKFNLCDSGSNSFLNNPNKSGGKVQNNKNKKTKGPSAFNKFSF